MDRDQEADSQWTKPPTPPAWDGILNPLLVPRPILWNFSVSSLGCRSLSHSTLLKPADSPGQRGLSPSLSFIIMRQGVWGACLLDRTCTLYIPSGSSLHQNPMTSTQHALATWEFNALEENSLHIPFIGEKPRNVAENHSQGIFLEQHRPREKMDNLIYWVENQNSTGSFWSSWLPISPTLFLLLPPLLSLFLTQDSAVSVESSMVQVALCTLKDAKREPESVHFPCQGSSAFCIGHVTMSLKRIAGPCRLQLTSLIWLHFAPWRQKEGLWVSVKTPHSHCELGLEIHKASLRCLPLD